MSTELACAQVGTIRLKLLKIEAVIWRNTRRIRFSLSSAWPDEDPFAMVAQRLTAGSRRLRRSSGSSGRLKARTRNRSQSIHVNHRVRRVLEVFSRNVFTPTPSTRCQPPEINIRGAFPLCSSKIRVRSISKNTRARYSCGRAIELA
jgi:hypothetical protein